MLVSWWIWWMLHIVHILVLYHCVLYSALDRCTRTRYLDPGLDHSVLGLGLDSAWTRPGLGLTRP